MEAFTSKKDLVREILETSKCPTDKIKRLNILTMMVTYFSRAEILDLLPGKLHRVVLRGMKSKL